MMTMGINYDDDDVCGGDYEELTPVTKLMITPTTPVIAVVTCLNDVVLTG